jgi:TolB-like protein/Tfp pilus assembly protein PilF
MDKNVEVSQEPRPSPNERLDSWKEIAAYLKCSERTVRRWEDEGLPVHRHTHKKKPGIYAYKAEIDVWWRNGHERLKQVEDPQKPSTRSLPKWGVALALAAVALAAVTATLIIANRFRGTGSRVMLAVLPFENLSGNPEQEYLSDGMTEEMITQLSNLQPDRLGVIARTSSMKYKGARMTVREIGRELGVDYVLEGSVHRLGSRVHVTAQLIQVSDQAHLFAESHDRDLGDIVALQEEVAQIIAQHIGIELTANVQARSRKISPVQPEAYEAYLKGRYALNARKAAGFKQALEQFQRAIQLDPTYAPAYAGLADTFSLMGLAPYAVLPSAEVMEKARAAAQTAISLDDSLAEAHASLAIVLFSYQWDWVACEREFRRAIALNPGYATAHLWYSEYLEAMGRFVEAQREDKLAQTLDPVSPVSRQELARLFYFSRQFEESLKVARTTVELEPNFPIGHMRMARAYVALGQYNEAVQEFQKFATLGGDQTLALAFLGHAYAQSGDQTNAAECLGKLQALAAAQPLASYRFAILYTGLGARDQAIDALEKTFEERSDGLAFLKVEPLFDPLRSHPRFEELMRRMNFPK